MHVVDMYIYFMEAKALDTPQGIGAIFLYLIFKNLIRTLMKI